MNVADIIKLIREGLDAEGKIKIPVVPPGTPISVYPCVVIAPSSNDLEDAGRTLRYGFDITPSVPRSSQPEQFELLTELEAIVLRSLRPTNVRFDGPFSFRVTGPETGEAPAQARVIPISFAADVDLCP